MVCRLVSGFSFNGNRAVFQKIKGLLIPPNHLLFNSEKYSHLFSTKLFLYNKPPGKFQEAYLFDAFFCNSSSGNFNSLVKFLL